ncbi:MAG TPA: RES domain-containing protein [Acidobacteriota bacterium]|nr:RES domain-containing protein [Acidobacteriota bacterium]
MTTHDLIALARSLDSTTASVADYRALFDRIANGHIFVTITPQGGFWYRVRPNLGETHFNTIKDLWYPPADRVRLGRANEPGKPVLYLANSGAVALRETLFTSGAWLSVLTCRVTKHATLKLQEIGLREHVRHGNLPSTYEKIELFIANAHTHGYGDPLNQPLVRRYFAEEFTREISLDNEHAYKPTAAISALLMSWEDCDGIAYPAIKSAKQDINIALKPDAADRKLEVVGIDVVQALRLPDGEIAVTRLATSSQIAADGTISYRNAHRSTASLSWVDNNRPIAC